MRYVCACVCLFFTSNAVLASHCPHGQIYRVHLYECVDVHSSLARAYVRRVAMVHKEPPLEPIIVNPDSIFPPETIYELNKELEKLHSR